MAGKGKKRIVAAIVLFKQAALLLLQFSLFLVFIYRVVPVPVTPLMVMRGEGIDKEWIALERMSKKVPIAAIASEDPKFTEHYGFDFEAIWDALNANLNGKKLRGGSTISQQTAKNVFLWQGRNFVRKGLEVPFTILIETFWTKKRIMEVYLNVIEMGNGIYGIEAASLKYYKKSSARLSAAEAAGIVVCFPNPRMWKPGKHPKYIATKLRNVNRWMIGYEPVPAWWYK